MHKEPMSCLEQQTSLRNQGIAFLKLMNFAEWDILAQSVIHPNKAKRLLRESLGSGKNNLHDKGQGS